MAEINCLTKSENNQLTITDNSISVFKFIAAFQVLYGHATYHLEIATTDWLDSILGVFQGVPVFFTVSGFLIWFSIERTIANRGVFNIS